MQSKAVVVAGKMGWVFIGIGLALVMNSAAQGQSSRSVLFGEPLAAPNVPQAGIVPSYNPALGMGIINPREGYVIYVNGDSDLLLAQAQRVEPLAFRRFWNGRSVIQAGFFTGRGNAENRLAELRAQGLDAQLAMSSGPVATTAPQTTIASYNTSYSAPFTTGNNVASNVAPSAGLGVLPVPGTNPPLAGQTVTVYSNTAIGQAGSSGGAGPQLTFTAPPGAATPSTTRYPGYYVVVPGSSNRLPELAAQIQRLGADPANLFQRQQPRGPHVAMGPFPDRASAEQWNKYLREFGLDARLHFEQ